MKIAEKFFKRVENTVVKGEIACYEQFLLFPHCFKKACFPGASKGVIVWEWVKPFQEKSLVQTFCEKDKMLVPIIFSSSHSVLFPKNIDFFFF